MLRENIKETQKQIIAKAWKDNAFMQVLRCNPKEALADLKNDIGLFVNLSENTLAFYLPPSPVQMTELSEHESFVTFQPPFTADPCYSRRCK